MHQHMGQNASGVKWPHGCPWFSNFGQLLFRYGPLRKGFESMSEIVASMLVKEPLKKVFSLLATLSLVYSCEDYPKTH